MQNIVRRNSPLWMTSFKSLATWCSVVPSPRRSGRGNDSRGMSMRLYKPPWAAPIAPLITKHAFGCK